MPSTKRKSEPSILHFASKIKKATSASRPKKSGKILTDADSGSQTDLITSQIPSPPTSNGEDFESILAEIQQRFHQKTAEQHRRAERKVRKTIQETMGQIEESMSQQRKEMYFS